MLEAVILPRCVRQRGLRHMKAKLAAAGFREERRRQMVIQPVMIPRCVNRHSAPNPPHLLRARLNPSTPLAPLAQTPGKLLPIRSQLRADEDDRRFVLHVELAAEPGAGVFSEE